MVTSFSDKDGVIDVVDVVVVVVVVSTMLALLSAVIIEDEVVDEEELNVSSSSGGNVGKEIDTLEALFEPADVDSSSSSSSKGDLPTTLVPSSLLSTPEVLPMPPPRRLRRMTGPRTRMISPIIELTFDSIL